jgi:chromate transporter
MNFLKLWLTIGLQSFGGGATTLALIRSIAVEQEGWLSEGEFTNNWALVQAVPGINLLALTILVSRKAAGLKGVILALLGLLVPSITITLILTVVYQRIQTLELVETALDGVIPATIGLGLLTATKMLRPLLVTSLREGQNSFLSSVVLLLGSMGAMRFNLPVAVILCLAGGISAILSWLKYNNNENSFCFLLKTKALKVLSPIGINLSKYQSDLQKQKIDRAIVSNKLRSEISTSLKSRYPRL